MNIGFIPDELGMITGEGVDPITGETCVGTKTYYFYTCSHCSKCIVLNDKRTRDRVRCKRCWRVICEKTPLCREVCTPLNLLYEDGFEANEKWTKYVPAIMQGVQTSVEAEEKGLVIPGVSPVEVD